MSYHCKKLQFLKRSTEALELLSLNIFVNNIFNSVFKVGNSKFSKNLHNLSGKVKLNSKNKGCRLIFPLNYRQVQT